MDFEAASREGIQFCQARIDQDNIFLAQNFCCIYVSELDTQRSTLSFNLCMMCTQQLLIFSSGEVQGRVGASKKVWE